VGSMGIEEVLLDSRNSREKGALEQIEMLEQLGSCRMGIKSEWFRPIILPIAIDYCGGFFEPRRRDRLSKLDNDYKN